MPKLSSITLAVVVAALPLAGCTTHPSITVGKPVYTTLSGTPVALTHPPLQPVRKGCAARARSIWDTTEVDPLGIYGIYYNYGDYGALIDDAKKCFRRHGFILAGWRQPDGRVTPYQYHDNRLDY